MDCAWRQLPSPPRGLRLRRHNALQPHAAPPVLHNDLLSHLQPVNVKVLVDCSVGPWSHACGVASTHPEVEHLVAMHLDPAALGAAQRWLAEGPRPPGLQASFFPDHLSELEAVLRGLPCGSLYGQVDAIVLDLQPPALLLQGAAGELEDVRLDDGVGPGAILSAEEVVNSYSEAQLGQILRDWGEDKSWKAAAQRIVRARERGRIRSTRQLAEVLASAEQGGKQQAKGRGGKPGAKQERQQQRPHPACSTMQALRIAASGGLDKLEQALPAAIAALRPGGRLAVISGSNVEDKAVKRAFQRASGRPTAEQERLAYGDAKYALLDELERGALVMLVTRKAVEVAAGEGAAGAGTALLRVVEKRVPSQATSLGPGIPSGPRVPPGAVQVRPTPDGRGNGAFATQPIPRGCYVCDYEGEVLDGAQYFARYPDGTSDYVTELDEQWHIDAAPLVGQTSIFSAVHMNHSRVRANVLRYKDAVARRVAFFSARDIAAGEELLYDYGPKYWRGREQMELP